MFGKFDCLPTGFWLYFLKWSINLYDFFLRAAAARTLTTVYTLREPAAAARTLTPVDTLREPAAAACTLTTVGTLRETTTAARTLTTPPHWQERRSHQPEVHWPTT